MSHVEEKIIIVALGIAGLTTATALRQRGFEVAVFEQATELPVCRRSYEHPPMIHGR